VQRARTAARDNAVSDRTTLAVRNLFDWTDDDWNTVVDGGGADKVLIDPPREGRSPWRGRWRRPGNVRRVVYVSCNPATLARDCAVMVHEVDGRWRAAGVLNMFPHTSHVESIAVLEPGAA